LVTNEPLVCVYHLLISKFHLFLLVCLYHLLIFKIASFSYKGLPGLSARWRPKKVTLIIKKKKICYLLTYLHFENLGHSVEKCFSLKKCYNQQLNKTKSVVLFLFQI